MQSSVHTTRAQGTLTFERAYALLNLKKRLLLIRIQNLSVLLLESSYPNRSSDGRVFAEEKIYPLQNSTVSLW